MRYICEKEKQIRIAGEFDICVIGGGCTGVFAAVRAARLGANVAIIEKTSCFGGVSTLAGINVWHSIYDFTFEKQIIAGLSTEILERLKSRGDCKENKHSINMFYFNTEEMKIELDKIICESKVHPFLHTSYAAPILESDELIGVYIENKDGRSAVLAKFFIDCSGDGDLCRDLRLNKYVYEGAIMPPSPCFRVYKEESYPVLISELIKKHGIEFGLTEDWGWNVEIPEIEKERLLVETHVLDLPCTCAENITKCEIEGRRQIRSIIDLLRKYMPDGDFVRLADISSTIGIRESAHYETNYKVKTDELLNGKTFPTAVLNSAYCLDVHSSSSSEVLIRHLDGSELRQSRGVKKESRWRTYADGNYPRYWQVPFESIITDRCNNLLLAGRMLDAEHGAFSALRVRINLNQLGEAAGVAAFAALQLGKSVLSVDVDYVRKLLSAGGSIII